MSAAIEVDESSLPTIRLNDRIAIFGRTGTGKSILAHYLFNTIPLTKRDKIPANWRICIDVTDSVVDGSLTFFDPNQIPWQEAGSLRYVPNVETMEADINVLYLNCLDQGSVWIWLDEANEVSTAHRTIFGMRKVLLQGRKFQIGHCAVTPRPVDIAKSINTQSEHLFIFPLTDYNDRRTISQNIGLSADEFDETMASLDDFGYLWYSVRDGLLMKLPPLPIDVVEKLE